MLKLVASVIAIVLIIQITITYIRKRDSYQSRLKGLSIRLGVLIFAIIISFFCWFPIRSWNSSEWQVEGSEKVRLAKSMVVTGNLIGNSIQDVHDLLGEPAYWDDVWLLDVYYLSEEYALTISYGRKTL